jgi:hypothetical protein
VLLAVADFAAHLSVVMFIAWGSARRFRCLAKFGDGGPDGGSLRRRQRPFRIYEKLRGDFAVACAGYRLLDFIEPQSLSLNPFRRTIVSKAATVRVVSAAERSESIEQVMSSMRRE